MKTKHLTQEQRTLAILYNSIRELKHANFSLSFFPVSNDAVYEAIKEIENTIRKLQSEVETVLNQV